MHPICIICIFQKKIHINYISHKIYSLQTSIFFSLHAFLKVRKLLHKQRITNLRTVQDRWYECIKHDLSSLSYNISFVREISYANQLLWHYANN